MTALTALQPALPLGSQGPPTDWICVTEPTLTVSGTKWAPACLMPLPTLLGSASVHRMDTQSLSGAHALGGLLPPQFLRISYQTNTLTTAAAPKGAVSPGDMHHQATCRCKCYTDVQKHSGCHLVSSALDTVCGHPLTALCLHFPFV